MNRMQPCDVCGCPTLFHSPRRTPGATGPARMVCEDCTRKTGREQVCGVDED